MLLSKKADTSTDEFWREYEEKTGEKVEARGLGKYISGWDEFDQKKWNGIWGLIVTTSGGFRFHNFPQNSWIDAFTAYAAKEPPKEKTIFIPKEKIVSSEMKTEKNWWRKIFIPSPPHLVIIYLNEAGSERKLIFEAEYNSAYLFSISV